jgi:trimeric autotransporter adhesin
MPLFTPLPPPPNKQSIADVQLKKDKEGKVTDVIPSTNWTWSDWLQRLFEKLKTLTVLPALGTSNQLLGVNAAGSDLEYKTLGVQGVAGTLPASSGGTGLNSFAVGDLLYANTTSTLARLADVADGQVLGSKGVGVAPAYRTLASLGFALDYASLGTAPVASGTDSIAIGDSAVASALGTVAIGVSTLANTSMAVAFGNAAQATNTNAVAIGVNSQASASGAVALGVGAVASGTNSTAIGNNVQATGNNSIALGNNAVISAGTANAIALGFTNMNGNASICISASPTAITFGNAQNCVQIGTYRNGGQPYGVNGTVNNFLSLGTGNNVDFAGEMSWSEGNFVAGTSGTAKVGMFPMRAQTTNATVTPLGTATGANPTGVNPGGQIVLPTVSSWAFDCLIIARRTDATGTNAAWKLKFSAKKDSTNASTALVGSRVKEVLQKDVGAASWDIGVSVDTGTGAVFPTVTGEAGKTIRWVANVRMTKVMES